MFKRMLKQLEEITYECGLKKRGDDLEALCFAAQQVRREYNLLQKEIQFLNKPQVDEHYLKLNEALRVFANYLPLIENFWTLFGTKKFQLAFQALQIRQVEEPEETDICRFCSLISSHVILQRNLGGINFPSSAFSEDDANWVIQCLKQMENDYDKASGIRRWRC
jgi:hypothetical protein